MAAVDRHAEWTSVEKVLDYLSRADAIPHRTEGEGDGRLLALVLLDCAWKWLELALLAGVRPAG